MPRSYINIEKEDVPACVRECMEEWVYGCGYSWTCMAVHASVSAHKRSQACTCKAERDKQIVSLKQLEPT